MILFQLQGWLTLGWPNQTSNFEDPQPHPQKLRFFEAEDQLFKNI